MEGNTEIQSSESKEIVAVPQIKIGIFYSPHRSAEDMDGLKDQFQKCDIYFPETFGWEPEYLDSLRKLSNGEITPEMALRDWGDRDPYYYSRDKEFFKIIYNSKKLIAFLDVPESHPLVGREKENKVPKIQLGSNFGQTLDSVRRHIEEFSAIQKERETYMLEQLQPQIQELLKTHSKLREKQEINTLISIGVAHTSLYRNLREDYQTTRRFSKMPTIFPYREEAIRRYMLNEPIDDELTSRIVAERLISKAHMNLFRTSDSVKDAIAVRRVVSRLSFDEMKKMFESAHDLNEWANMFVQGLKERVKVPTTGN